MLFEKLFSQAQFVKSVSVYFAVQIREENPLCSSDKKTVKTAKVIPGKCWDVLCKFHYRLGQIFFPFFFF